MSREVRVPVSAGEAPSRALAEILVSTGAVSFRTSPFFTFTSGVESPVYVDNRRLLGFVVERRQIVAAFAALARELHDDDLQAVAGTATAGIPWAAWLAEALELPMMYARSEAKTWGHQRAIEGAAPDGARTLVIEDLAFSGGSLHSAVENLRRAGYDVAHCLTIVTYQMPAAAQRFNTVDVHHTSLTTIDAALDVAAASGALTPDETATVREWLRTQRARSITSPRSHEGSPDSG